MNSYLVFLIFTAASTGLIGLIVFLNWLLGPRVEQTAVKLEPFECGSRPLQGRNVRPLSIKYYPVAIFFLLFDGFQYFQAINTRHFHICNHQVESALVKKFKCL